MPKHNRKEMVISAEILSTLEAVTAGAAARCLLRRTRIKPAVQNILSAIAGVAFVGGTEIIGNSANKLIDGISQQRKIIRMMEQFEEESKRISVTSSLRTGPRFLNFKDTMENVMGDLIINRPPLMNWLWDPISEKLNSWETNKDVFQTTSRLNMLKDIAAHWWSEYFEMYGDGDYYEIDIILKEDDISMIEEKFRAYLNS